MSVRMLCWTLLFVAASALADDFYWMDFERAAQYQPRDTLRVAERALDDARRRSDVAGQINALRKLTYSEVLLQRMQSVQEHYEQGAALARQAGDAEALCYFLGKHAILAIVRHNQAQKGRAEQEEAFALAQKHGLKRMFGYLYLWKANAAMGVGLETEPFEADLKAYDILTSVHDTLGVATVLMQQGMVLSMRSPADEKSGAAAINYFKQALETIDPKVYRALGLRLLLFLGNAHAGLKDLANARTYLVSAVEVAEELGSNDLVSSLFVLSEVESELQHPRAALTHADRAAQLLESGSAGNAFLDYQVAFRRAQALYELARHDDSRNALAVAERKLKTLSLPSGEKVRFGNMVAELSSRLGDYKKAYEYSRMEHAGRDELQKANDDKRTGAIQAGFESRLRDAENSRLKAEQREAQANGRALMLGFSLCVVLLAAAALFMRRRALSAKLEAAHHQALATVESARADAQEAANRAKSVFLASMSHELRTPLNAMLGFTRLLARDARLPAPARADLAAVLKSGEHLHTLIDQVLDLSRIEAGRATREDADFSLRELLAQLHAMFAAAARRKGLALVVDAAQDMPELVRTDALKLRQVLVNLVGNALKFTARGSVTLSVALKPGGEGVLSFCVADTGPGIAPEELQQLGSLFVQGAAGARAREGTGLGLAISSGFVQLLGGKLELTSELGAGTRAMFEIPVQPAAQALAPASPARRAIALAPGQPHWRIAVVDDRAESRQLVLRCLQPLGLELREAADGEQACQLADSWHPHLVFMDMRMPVMDGWEATRRIKAGDAGRQAKIIALTASSFEEERQQILAAGCDDFLSKPWREEALVQMLERHLGARFEHEAAPEQVLDAARLAALQRPLREELADALERLDVEAVERAFEAVRQHDPGLAELIAPLVHGFEHQRLANLLQAADGATAPSN